MDRFTLLIDDMRSGNFDHIARTSEEGKQALLTLPVTELFMDHDLGECDYFGVPNEDAAFRNGYELLVWALEEGVCPPHVMPVTMNPVGRKNMIAALEAHGYTHNDGWWSRT